MTREGWGLVIVALIVVPWALLMLVALLRGYSIHLDRHPTSGRHRRTQNGDGHG